MKIEGGGGSPVPQPQKVVPAADAHPAATRTAMLPDRDRRETAPPPTPFSTPMPPSMPTPTPTATPTVTPTAPPAAGPVYWGGLTEAQLAAFQQRQGTGRNDCADYSIAAVFNMFQGGAVQGSDVARAADLGNVLYGYRLWPNGPTTPGQTANIINTIADRAGLPVSATALRATTTADLVGYLQQPDTAVVVTIGWDDAHVPQIARTADLATSAGGGATLQINAHAMVLAAYDPSHVDHGGNPAPWGFVNSWADGGTEIYWMPDADFQRAWTHEIPLVGSRNAVVITRTGAAATPTAVASATSTPTATATLTPAPVATPASPAATPSRRR
jgi:hypothetical protein